MNKHQKIIISIVGIVIVLLALVGITYGYFLTRIIGNTNDKSVSIKTALLELKYDDESSQINMSNLFPGQPIPSKTFSVENRGQGEVEYGVYLENVVNELVLQDDLLISLTCTSVDRKTGVPSGSCVGTNPDEEYYYPATNEQIITNTIDVGLKHNYTLIITYLDDGNQSVDMGKTIEGKVQIYAVDDVFDIEVDGTNLADTDVLELHSEVKTARKVNGKYKFVGVMPDEHEIIVKDKTNTQLGTTNLIIDLGTKESYTNGTVNVTKDTKKLNITISSIIDNKVNINDVTYGNQIPINSFAYKILDNAMKELNGTKYTENLLSEIGMPILMNVGGSSQTKVEYDASSWNMLIETNKDVLNLILYVSKDDYESNPSLYSDLLWDCYYSADFSETCPATVKVYDSYKNTCNDLEESYFFTYGEANLNNPLFADAGYFSKAYYVKECVNGVPSDGVELEKESILSKTNDENGESYYFRGAVKNNYVTFNNMCWRIIRIDGNNNIKLILQDFAGGCNPNNINNYRAYLKTGYLSDSDTSLTPSHLNNHYSAMDNLLLNGGNVSYNIYDPSGRGEEVSVNYNINAMSDTNKSKLVLNKNYVNFDKKYSTDDFSLLTSTTNQTNWYYDPYVRIEKNGNVTLDEQGSRLNDSYVTLISADEAIYAGFAINSSSYSYLLDNLKTSVELYSEALGNWTDSIVLGGEYSNRSYVLHDSGQLKSSYTTMFWSGYNTFRPVITLDNSKVSVTGTGTLDDPYVVS